MKQKKRRIFEWRAKEVKTKRNNEAENIEKFEYTTRKMLNSKSKVE